MSEPPSPHPTSPSQSHPGKIGIRYFYCSVYAQNPSHSEQKPKSLKLARASPLVPAPQPLALPRTSTRPPRPLPGFLCCSRTGLLASLASCRRAPALLRMLPLQSCPVLLFLLIFACVSPYQHAALLALSLLRPYFSVFYYCLTYSMLYFISRPPARL